MYSPAWLWQSLAEGSHPLPASDSSDPCPVDKSLLPGSGCLETSLQGPGLSKPGPSQHCKSSISVAKDNTVGDREEEARETGRACENNWRADAQPASLKERGPLWQALSSVLTLAGLTAAGRQSTFIVRKQKGQFR